MGAVTKLGTEPDPKRRIRQRQGQTIRKFREFRDVTIGELAATIGVTPGAVSQWETGRYTPRQDVQVRIAKALDVPWSSIFGLDAEAVA